MRYEIFSDSSISPLKINSIGFSRDTEVTRFGPGQRNLYIIHYVTKGKGYYNEAIPVYIQGKDRVSYKISYSKLKNCDVSNLKAYYIDELGKAKKMCMLVLSES